MLIQAAAQQWKVDPARCTAADGQVRHLGSGSQEGFRALAGAASKLAPPKDPPLKDPNNFTLIGKSLKRLDTTHKVDGGVVYGIDVMLPGMKFATLAASPVFGGKVAHVDPGPANRIPGVRKVVVLDDMVAVVGDHMWAAKQGLRALDISWDEGPNADVSSADIWQHLRKASETTGAVAKNVGDVEKALSQGEKHEAAYELPFLAHATMEPLNCTVHLKPDSCEIWLGSQVLSRAQAVAAQLTGLPLDRVTAHNHLIGGGFGRRLEVDYVAKAVRIAKHVDGPVKVVWSREEDIAQDIYRPVYRDRLSASLANGRIVGWSHRI